MLKIRVRCTKGNVHIIDRHTIYSQLLPELTPLLRQLKHPHPSISPSHKHDRPTIRMLCANEIIYQRSDEHTTKHR